MIAGKKSYEEIPVPECLDEVFFQACRRGRKTIAVRRMKKAALAGAACICFVAFTGNETIYAKLSEIPVIGQVVQMIHSGQGGEITDGAAGKLAEAEGNLQVYFGSEVEKVPHYTVQYLQAPERIQITLDGVRGFDRDRLNESAKILDGVKDIYFITYLDDSSVRFAIELEEGFGYQVKEFEKPGYLEISFGLSESAPAAGSSWYIRSESMEMGESLALMQENYDALQSEITKTSDGRYALQIGPFADKQEAELALEKTESIESGDILYLEECLSGRLK